MLHRLLSIVLMCMLIGLAACNNHSPVRTEKAVDLSRYMGDWYVIANIPSLIEKNAYNAVESYRLKEDGSIATTFTFREGGFDGTMKDYHPTGYIVDRESNAVWGMQFVWPIKADYRIMYVDKTYGQTIVGRNKRDYVWLMARTPEISEADYERFLGIIAKEGYDVSQVRKVPQRW